MSHRAHSTLPSPNTSSLTAFCSTFTQPNHCHACFPPMPPCRRTRLCPCFHHLVPQVMLSPGPSISGCAPRSVAAPAGQGGELRGFTLLPASSEEPGTCLPPCCFVPSASCASEAPGASAGARSADSPSVPHLSWLTQRKKKHPVSGSPRR